MSTHTLSAIDRESLNQSLLLETVKLFALAAQADKVISDSESAYVRQYFARSYPEEFTDFLHQEFLRLAEQQQEIEEVTAYSREQLSYEEKIFLMAKLLELLSADEMTEEEQQVWFRVGDALQVDGPDLQVLQTLVLGTESSTQSSAHLRWLQVTGYGEGGDAELPIPGLNLLVIRANRQVFLLHKDEMHVIRAQGQRVLPGQVYRLPNEAAFFVDNFVVVRAADLKFFFRNLDHEPVTHALMQVGNGFEATSPESDEALFHLDVDEGRLTLTPHATTEGLLLNAEPVTEPRQIHLNDTLQYGSLRLNLRAWLLHQKVASTVLRVQERQEEFQIGNQFECDILIDDSLEMPWQCILEACNPHYRIHPDTCPYPIWLNDERISGTKQFGKEDRIRIKQTLIIWDESRQSFEVRDTALRSLEARDLVFAFKDGTKGLDGASFRVKRGELVGILGPSGSGKSTLLSLINGWHTPQEGRVTVDGYDLHEHFERFRDRMGHVPQDDLLFENLTVYENLYFNARLRYPDGTHDIPALVNSVLRDIGLYEKRNLIVGSPEHKILSGGQRKRLNIGLELLADNDLLMLDEPTSGLSSKDSERIMRLIRHLASRGKLIFVVIHQPSSRLYAMFDRFIVMDRGGKLAFFGEKEEVLQYFQGYSDSNSPDEQDTEALETASPELILDTLEQPLRDIDGTPLPIRRYAPEFWQQAYKEYRGDITDSSEAQKEEAPPLPWRQKRSLSEQLSIFGTLVRRNFIHKLRDRSNLLVTFLIPPLLALIVGLILRYQDSDGYTLFNNLHLTTFLFLAVLIGIFLGVTNSVEEIIRDQRILMRERMLDVSRLSYYLAKLLTLSGFAVVQNLLFLIVGFLTLELRELFFSMWLLLMLTSMCGISLGLFVSSLPGLSAKGAVNLVPIILIPQIIFGGALVEYKKMNQQLTIIKESPIPEVCQVMVSRWAFEGLVTLQGYQNSYHPQEEIMMEELTDLKRYERKDEIARLTAELGDEATAKAVFSARVDSIEGILDGFRQEFRDGYGNRMLNQAVISAQNDYERQQLEGGSPVYPLFVAEKKIPFTNMTLPTPWYNALVLIGIMSFLVGMGLVMLYRRF